MTEEVSVPEITKLGTAVDNHAGHIDRLRTEVNQTKDAIGGTETRFRHGIEEMKAQIGMMRGELLQVILGLQKRIESLEIALEETKEEEIPQQEEE